MPTCFTQLRTFSSFNIHCTFQPHLKSFEKKSLLYICVRDIMHSYEVLLYYCYLELRNSLNLYLIPLKIPKIHYTWPWLWCIFCNVFFGIENISSERSHTVRIQCKRSLVHHQNFLYNCTLGKLLIPLSSFPITIVLLWI